MKLVPARSATLIGTLELRTASNPPMLRITALLLVAVGMAGCVRRDGRNADCRWPGEPGAQRLDLSRLLDRRHLSADAEFAEQLAILHADTQHGLRSGHFKSREAYAKARNQCLATAFAEIGNAHGVTPAQVYESLGRNRALTDFALNLPILLASIFAASLVTGRIWSRYLSEDSRTTAVILVTLCSLVFAAATVILGEQWATIAESARIGSGHLSYRMDRLPWIRYRTQLFAAGVLLVLLIASLRYRRPAAPSSPL